MCYVFCLFNFILPANGAHVFVQACACFFFGFLSHFFFILESASVGQHLNSGNPGLCMAPYRPVIFLFLYGAIHPV